VKVLATILVVLFGVAAPASAKTILNDKSSSRSLHIVHKKDRMAELRKLVPNYKFFIAIGRCEQPGDGKWGIAWSQTRNWSYPGGLGVWEPLWREEGIDGRDLAPSADKATPLEQMIQAQRIVDKYGPYAWGCTGVAMAQAPFYENAKAPSKRQIRDFMK